MKDIGSGDPLDLGSLGVRIFLVISGSSRTMGGWQAADRDSEHAAVARRSDGGRLTTDRVLARPASVAARTYLATCADPGDAVQSCAHLRRLFAVAGRRPRFCRTNRGRRRSERFGSVAGRPVLRRLEARGSVEDSAVGERDQPLGSHQALTR